MIVFILLFKLYKFLDANPFTIWISSKLTGFSNSTVIDSPIPDPEVASHHVLSKLPSRMLTGEYKYRPLKCASTSSLVATTD